MTHGRFCVPSQEAISDPAHQKEEAPHGGMQGFSGSFSGTVMGGGAHHPIGMIVVAYGKMTALQWATAIASHAGKGPETNRAAFFSPGPMSATGT